MAVKLPRSLSQAKKLGGKEVPKPTSRPLAQFSTIGRRDGSPCDIHPGTVPGSLIICFYDKDTGQCTDCHEFTPDN